MTSVVFISESTPNFNSGRKMGIPKNDLTSCISWGPAYCEFCKDCKTDCEFITKMESFGKSNPENPSEWQICIDTILEKWIWIRVVLSHAHQILPTFRKEKQFLKVWKSKMTLFKSYNLDFLDILTPIYHIKSLAMWIWVFEKKSK